MKMDEAGGIVLMIDSVSNLKGTRKKNIEYD